MLFSTIMWSTQLHIYEYIWLVCADQIFPFKEEKTQYGVSLANPLSVILLYKKHHLLWKVTLFAEYISSTMSPHNKAGYRYEGVRDQGQQFTSNPLDWQEKMILIIL